MHSVFLHRGLLGLAAVMLAGCGMQDGPGAFLIDPAHYTAYHCEDLATQWKVLVARERELHGLMDKASEGPGGAVVGSLAYRTDYESVLSEEKLLQRTAMEKKCGFTPEFQSDQTIR
ncbi:MAG TPA: twin-arginine translocation pathway signal [Xanthobacteraceae bacterium]|nr:twin-arginine translocation pathway signal [Xanthobacteraceae bacterium]